MSGLHKLPKRKRHLKAMLLGHSRRRRRPRHGRRFGGGGGDGLGEALAHSTGEMGHSRGY